MTGPNEVSSKCPEGMALIKSENAAHPDEPVFCIDKTEVAQKRFMEFLKSKFPDEYKEVSALLAKNIRGDKKPAVYVPWAKAEAYCRFRGGDLPTEKQWENACGKGKYCTASGKLNHQEAIYSVDGPADVGSTPAGPNGLHDLTGNVWEWMKDDARYGFKRIRGGSWDDFNAWFLRADFRYFFHPDFRLNYVGFRCVVPPQDSKK